MVTYAVSLCGGPNIRSPIVRSLFGGFIVLLHAHGHTVIFTIGKNVQ